MRPRLLHVRAFALATATVASLMTMASATPADARRVARAERDSDRHHIVHRRDRDGGWSRRRVHRVAHHAVPRGHRHHARTAKGDALHNAEPHRRYASTGSRRVRNGDRSLRWQTRPEGSQANQAWSAWSETPRDWSSQPGGEAAAMTPSNRISRGHAAARTATQDRFAAAAGSAVDRSGLVAEARRWIGTNPTNRRSLWCGAFMNLVLERSGHEGTGSDLAKSFASIGQRVSGPQIGAIAVMARRGGGHVGVVSGIDSAGNPIIISGNSRGRRVAEGTYPRGRVYAYVMP